MKLIRFACALLIVSCAWLMAQTPKKPAFEVASIKPAPSMASLIMDLQSGKRGIGALQTTIDGARVDIGYASLNELLAHAYRLKPHQIIGPDWLNSQAYEIHATIPEGASKDQVPEMIQTMLAERFKLAAHQDNKEQPVYALIVSKDGHKLKEAVVEAEAPAAPKDSAKTPPAQDSAGKDKAITFGSLQGSVTMKPEAGGMAISSERTGQIRINMGPNGVVLLELSKVTMADLADRLTGLMDRPVLDMTALKGSYQVSLEIPQEDIVGIAKRIAASRGLQLPAMTGGANAIAGAASGAGGLAASDPSGGAIFRAIQKLGLKLDSRKAPVEALIIDHIEKDPTEN
jgi:uncharacterized protein (TIGR03435 family)